MIVLVLYGVFWYLQKYTADQTIVQRYLVAESDRAAVKGIILGAVLCVVIWAVFMSIGSLLWSFYRITDQALPAHIHKTDQVFPYFLSTRIPSGMSGLFVASLLAAAMSTLASDLNCLAVAAVEDFYRFFKPESTDRQRLNLGKIVVTICGVLSLLIGVLLTRAQGTALSLWFALSSVASGGLAGLFFLTFLSSRANREGVLVGILASLVFTAWATLTLGSGRVLDLGRYNFPFHEFMIGVLANVVMLAVGYLSSLLLIGEEHRTPDLTLWKWLQKSSR